MRTWWYNSITVLMLTSLAGLGAPQQFVAAAPRMRVDVQKLRLTIAGIWSRFAADLEELAHFCDDRSFSVEADEIRALAQPLDPQILHGQNLPKEVQLPIPDDLSPDEKQWRTKLRARQLEFAQELFVCGRNSLNSGRISLAYELVREVARQNPDHEQARRLLGYVRHGNVWVTPYALLKLKQKHVQTQKYGWLPEEHVARYENGERYYQSQWMSVQKEAELRRDFSKAWLVETEHFKIRTNRSLESGVELGRHLEDYYHLFFQTFAGFLSSKEQLQSLFQGKGANGASRKYEVHYFRTRDEYNQQLQPKIKEDISITSGLYVSGDRVAYFFHDPDLQPAEQLTTVFHEATHQLFSEAISTTQPVGVHSDFWIIEGIACYMESFQRNGERFSLGDPQFIRFQNARTRWVNDHYFMPLRQFTALGQQAYYAHPEIKKNYSQASGVVHFLMHAEEGAYRDALTSYLGDVYSRVPRVRQRPRTLEELTDVKFAELDQEYLEYIAKLGE